jgi:hypothetical protein
MSVAKDGRSLSIAVNPAGNLFLEPFSPLVSRTMRRLAKLRMRGFAKLRIDGVDRLIWNRALINPEQAS